MKNNHEKMIIKFQKLNEWFSRQHKRLLKKRNKFLSRNERAIYSLMKEFRKSYEVEYLKTHCAHCGVTEKLQDIPFSLAKECLDCHVPLEMDDPKDRERDLNKDNEDEH